MFKGLTRTNFMGPYTLAVKRISTAILTVKFTEWAENFLEWCAESLQMFFQVERVLVLSTLSKRRGAVSGTSAGRVNLRKCARYTTHNARLSARNCVTAFGSQ